MLECAGARGSADLPGADLLGGLSPRTRAAGAVDRPGRPPRRNARTGRSPRRDRPVPVKHHVVWDSKARVPRWRQRPDAASPRSLALPDPRTRVAGPRRDRGTTTPRSAAAHPPIGAVPRSRQPCLRATALPRVSLRAPRRARDRRQGRRSPTLASAPSVLLPPGRSPPEGQRRGHRPTAVGPRLEVHSAQQHMLMSTGPCPLCPRATRAFRPGPGDRPACRSVPAAVRCTVPGAALARTG